MEQICQYCGKEFTTTKSGFINHERSCSKNPNKIIRKNKYTKNSCCIKEEGLFKCICEKEFLNSQSYKAHLGHCKIYHTSKEKPFKRIYKSPSDSNKEKLYEKKEYVCQYCGRIDYCNKSKTQITKGTVQTTQTKSLVGVTESFYHKHTKTKLEKVISNDLNQILLIFGIQILI